MSCPRLQVVLQTDLDLQLDAEMAAHAAICSDCGPAIERRRASYQLLRAEVPPLGSSDRAQLWWRIEEARRAPSRWSFHWSYAAAGAAAIALIIGVFVSTVQPDTENSGWAMLQGEARLMASEEAVPEGAPLPSHAWVIVPERASLAIDRAKIETTERTYLAVEARELRLARGALHLSIAEAAPSMVVTTPAARLEAIGASMRIQAARDHTIVEVLQGTVRAKEENGGKERTLRAGDRVVFGVAPAAKVPEPPQEIAMKEAPEEAPKPRPKRAAPKPVVEPIKQTPPPVKQTPDLTPPITPRVEQDRKDLDSARALLKTDHQRAGAIAEGVLRRSPSAPEEVHALSIAADAYRRSGRLLEAASTYARVSEHAAGEGYAEEALLRRAMIYDQLERKNEALVELDRAAKRFPRGYLHPERAALAAELLLKSGDIQGAANVLESAVASNDRTLDRTRIVVARALLASDPSRARRLIKTLISSAGPSQVEAQEIDAEAARRE